MVQNHSKGNYSPIQSHFQDILNEGGSTLLIKKHNGSIQSLLTTAYPEYEWTPWLFGKCPQNFWDSIENQKKFLSWVAIQRNVNSLDDWYHVSQKVTVGNHWQLTFIRTS